MSSGERELRDFVCTACGCLCDDLTLAIDDDRIASLAPPCPVAERFFLGPWKQPSAALIGGAPAAFEDAVTRAAELLQAAQSPLVMGFERVTVDSQRLAVEIADRLGATLDPTDDRGRSQSHAAVQSVGAVTATLGEVAQRSDLIIYWCVDPTTSHPRHMQRFTSPQASPLQRAGRRVIAINSARNATSSAVTESIEIAEGSGIESLSILRALLREVAVDPQLVQSQTGVPLATWREVADALKQARYAAIFYESDSGDPTGPEAESAAIAELVRDLHRHTRAVAMRLGGPGNAVGAAQVLTWQTGFPGAISFAGGYPRYLPGEASAAVLLARREVDAALIIGADPLPHLSAEAQSHLRSIPCIVLDDRACETFHAATVALGIARFGVESTGDVYRSDGVALPLKAALRATLPPAEVVLAQIVAKLR